MNANTDTNNLQNFLVYREGVLDEELSTIIKEPTPVEKLKGFINLQAEMALYDLLHRTGYRRTYNRLKREQRNRVFEDRLGLVRTK